MADDGAVVEARGLCKSYAGRQVVRDVSFAVAPGECLGLLGPNGAGKTTTIRMVTCFTPPERGTLRVLGHAMTPANHRAIKSRLGSVQQEESLDPDLSVEKNLIIYASYFGIPPAQAAKKTDELIRFAELDDHRTNRIATLSGGMKRRLMLARALLQEPALLVLDEPTTGLDPQARRLVWERVRSLKRHGTTILLTTHYMEEAAQLCDRLIIMDGGRIVAEGAPDDLIAKYVGSEVVEVYLSGEEPRDAEVVRRLAGGNWRAERVGEVLYLYLRDGQPEPAALVGVDFAHRRATLEDVFLTLTGHGLRE